MRVLHIIDSLKVGGAEKMVVSITNLLVTHGVQADVLIIGSAAPLADQLSERSKVYKIDRKWRWDLLAMCRIKKILQAYEIAHVHLHYNYRYIRLIQIIFGFKSRLLLHDHDNDFFCTGFMWRTFFRPKIYVSVNKKIVTLANRYFGPKTKCHLLSNLIIKIPETDSVTGGKGLVMVGNILPVKNYEFIFEVIAQLDLAVTIYGNIYDTDYFNRLKDQLDKAVISDKVTFVHDCQDVSKYLSQYDLAIHCAKIESGPLVILEYMADGLPLVTYNTGEIVEMVKIDFQEFVLETFDIDAWVNQIQFILARGRAYYKDQLIENIKRKRLSENYLKTCLKIYQSALPY